MIEGKVYLDAGVRAYRFNPNLPDPPIADRWCAACGEQTFWGCALPHHHWECISYADTRQLPCGCSAHKDCVKAALPCRSCGMIE